MSNRRFYCLISYKKYSYYLQHSYGRLNQDLQEKRQLHTLQLPFLWSTSTA
jgi:hypothetical protein